MRQCENLIVWSKQFFVARAFFIVSGLKRYDVLPLPIYKEILEIFSEHRICFPSLLEYVISRATISYSIKLGEKLRVPYNKYNSKDKKNSERMIKIGMYVVDVMKIYGFRV
jgi:hypothetical protein